MPRFPTFPDFIDEAKFISITNLKKWDYFIGYRSGVITWSRGERKIGSISIAVSVIDEKYMYLELSYTVNDKEDIKYKVPLIRVPSNLGKGYRWYFVCPATGKKCMKLYKIGNSKYFLHREAYKNIMYERQAMSHKNRTMIGYFSDVLDKLDKYQEEIFKPNAKRNYKGKPTKKVRKYLKVRNRVMNTEASSFFK